MIGLIFTRIFSYNLMLSSIIRKLYHFKPKFESEVKVKKKKTKGKKKQSAVDELAEQLKDNGDNDGDSDIEDGLNQVG